MQKTGLVTLRSHHLLAIIGQMSKCKTIAFRYSYFPEFEVLNLLLVSF